MYNLGVKLQKLDDLLLNLVVVFEARRIKSVTQLRAAEAAKQLVIRVRGGEISALILIAWLLHSSSVGVVYLVLLRTVFSKAALQKRKRVSDPVRSYFIRGKNGVRTKRTSPESTTDLRKR